MDQTSTVVTGAAVPARGVTACDDEDRRSDSGNDLTHDRSSVPGDQRDATGHQQRS
jgi:hypothetical protein